MKKVFSLLFIGLFLHAGEYWQSGKNFGHSALNYFKSNLSGTINKPMTTEQKLSTMDGKQKGKINLTCRNRDAKEFLDISYNANMYGDIIINISLDRNLDGRKDYSSNFSGISGICSNGVIKCNSGTWNNCKYYKWGLSSFSLTLDKTLATNLGGCYCINNSCGNISRTQKQKVLNDIAGAIAPFFTNNNRYVITKTENDGGHVKYWGQDYSNCDNFNGNKPNISMDGTGISSMTDSARLSEVNNPNSAYYVLNKSSGNNTNLDNNFKTNLKSRSSTVRSSANNTPNTTNYSYTDKIDGNTINVNGSLLIEMSDKAKYCEVEFIEQDTSSFNDGTNRKNSTTNNNIKKTEIRECTNNWTKCPVKDGETIKHDCGKIDDFAEVTSALNAVGEAVKDMVCSSLN